MRGSATHVLAACFALCAFAVAVVAGLASGNEAMTILLRAVVALMLCYPVGLLVGSVCERVVERHMESYRSAHPADGRTMDASASMVESRRDPEASSVSETRPA
ncbi:MAG: hypothetical protein HRU76_10630 [Phycisphaeraceae bacterium]|nr:hypothetical protein [Phycisphaerales bacterium]QOJ18014.1 MAG: hypothetical protein HRU76_10630 [Phycisphaeraceae bacterium]